MRSVNPIAATSPKRKFPSSYQVFLCQTRRPPLPKRGQVYPRFSLLAVVLYLCLYVGFPIVDDHPLFREARAGAVQRAPS